MALEGPTNRNDLLSPAPQENIRGPRSAHSRQKKNLIYLSSILSVIIFVWAFVREVRVVSSQVPTAWSTDANADCAVVLTGGPNRVREGIDLLSRGAIKKLIISGVNPQVELRDIFPQWPYYGEIRSQDVVLERRSLTTFGNAQQSRPLVEALDCRDLILITSQAHMHRALHTFRAEFPSDFPIISRAVVSSQVQPDWGEVTWEALKSLFYSIWAY